MADHTELLRKTMSNISYEDIRKEVSKGTDESNLSPMEQAALDRAKNEQVQKQDKQKVPQ